MDPRLLRYYNQELRYLREMGGEFAREFPKIASRLGMEAWRSPTRTSSGCSRAAPSSRRACSSSRTPSSRAFAPPAGDGLSRSSWRRCRRCWWPQIEPGARRRRTCCKGPTHAARHARCWAAPAGHTRHALRVPHRAGPAADAAGHRVGASTSSMSPDLGAVELSRLPRAAALRRARRAAAARRHEVRPARGRRAALLPRRPDRRGQAAARAA